MTFYNYVITCTVNCRDGGYPLFILDSGLYPNDLRLRDAIRSIPSAWNIFGYDFFPSWLEKSLKDREMGPIIFTYMSPSSNGLERLAVH